MKILKLAIDTGRMDLAAHALVYAIVNQKSKLKSQNSITRDSGGNDDRQQEEGRQTVALIQESKTCYSIK